MVSLNERLVAEAYAIDERFDVVQATLNLKANTADIPTLAGVPAWGVITGTLADQADLQTALDAKLTEAAADALYAPISVTGDLLSTNNLSDLDDPEAARGNLGLGNVAAALPLTFNFTAAGDAYFYADVAMTLTEQATTGAGTVSYEKGTTAAPDTFTGTTSPISLQAGAWLKVSSDDALAVHLKRTA
jgi:hypothetical protein